VSTIATWLGGTKSLASRRWLVFVKDASRRAVWKP